MTAATPATTCPSCGVKLDAATAVDGTPLNPRPGDVSVCLMCGTHLRFDDGLRLRQVQAGELPPGVVAALDQATALTAHFRREHAALIESERRAGRL